MSGEPFWRVKRLGEMSKAEWESLCDGCGRCCLLKLADEDSDRVDYTDVACRLLDLGTCRCSDYPNRRRRVRDCVQLTPAKLEQLTWMPSTCAYRLRHEGKPLPDWHPLLTGDPASTVAAGQSVQGWTVPEFEVDEDDWEDHIIEDL